MPETTGGKIAALVLMIAAPVCTVINYINGKAHVLYGLFS